MLTTKLFLLRVTELGIASGVLLST